MIGLTLGALYWVGYTTIVVIGFLFACIGVDNGVDNNDVPDRPLASGSCLSDWRSWTISDRFSRLIVSLAS